MHHFPTPRRKNITLRYAKKINTCFASSWLKVSLSRNSPDLQQHPHGSVGLIINLFCEGNTINILIYL